MKALFCVVGLLVGFSAYFLSNEQLTEHELSNVENRIMGDYWSLNDYQFGPLYLKKKGLFSYVSRDKQAKDRFVDGTWQGAMRFDYAVFIPKLKKTCLFIDGAEWEESGAGGFGGMKCFSSDKFKDQTSAFVRMELEKLCKTKFLCESLRNSVITNYTRPKHLQ